ncbi:MAG TPA: hypothetical protein VLF20_00985 [Patescibacteria group bacterium]|nr:hypothetical protein [Patescibacteria group bacterium]
MNMKKYIFTLLFFFLAGVYITYPLIFHLGDSVTGYGDELVYAWMYQWIIHRVLSGDLINLLNTNIFYPYQIALSTSDPQIVSAIIGVLPYFVIKEPIVVVNFTVISSISLLGFSVFLLTFYLTKDFWAALFSGILVIFSPAFLSFYMHIQMLAIVGVPLAILFFLLFFASGKFNYLVVSLSCFVLQTYNNFIAGYFILFSYIIFLFTFWFWKREQLVKRVTKRTLFACIVGLAFIIPIMIPYYHVSQKFQYVRDIRETVHLALQPEDFLYSSHFSHLQPYLNALPFNQVSQNDEFKPGYLGGVFTLLAVFVLGYCIRYFKEIDYLLKSFFSIGLLGLTLSLGPVLHLGRQTIHEPFLIPLPYALFYYLVPGFQGFRNSARWEMLFILAIAVAIALLLVKLLKRVDVKKRIIIYVLLIFACLIEYNFPMQFQKMPQVKDFPPVYSWLTTQPKETVIIELPVYNWNMPYANKEFWRMYYGTVHFTRTVNGTGGFTPPPWQTMVYEIDASFPSEETLILLRNMGVNTLIVHKEEFDQMYNDRYKVNGEFIQSGESIINQLNQSSHVKLLQQFGNDYVYTL